MRVYVIRHGESENNLAKKWTGWMDVHLTDKGKEVVATIEKDIVEYMSRAREGIPEENMLAFYGVLQSLENNISLIAYDEQ